MQCWGDESQPIVMWTPSFIDVIKSMRKPLLFKNFVSFLTNVERFASPQIPVLLPVSIQIHRAPEAEAVASDEDDHRRVDQEEDPCSSTTVLRMQHTFTVTLLLAAKSFQAHKSTTNKANSRIFRNLGADTTGFSVVVLKNGIVILRQL